MIRKHLTYLSVQILNKSSSYNIIFGILVYVRDLVHSIFSEVNWSTAPYWNSKKKKPKKREFFGKDDRIWSERFFSYLISCPSDKLICRSLASLTNWLLVYYAFFISFIFFWVAHQHHFILCYFIPMIFFLAFIALSLLLCVVPS